MISIGPAGLVFPDCRNSRALCCARAMDANGFAAVPGLLSLPVGETQNSGRGAEKQRWQHETNMLKGRIR